MKVAQAGIPVKLGGGGDCRLKAGAPLDFRNTKPGEYLLSVSKYICYFYFSDAWNFRRGINENFLILRLIIAHAHRRILALLIM
jgi:hypothetical protein